MTKQFLQKLINFLDQRNTTIVFLLIFGVLVSGIVYSIYLGDNLRYPDEQDYYKIANNLVSNKLFSLDGESPTAFRAPGYPITLAIFTCFRAKIVHLRIFNFIALGLSIYLLNEILKREATPLAATLGSLFVIGLPVLFYTAGALYPQTVASFILLLIIFLIQRNPSTLWVSLLIGVLVGYLILTIPAFIFLLIVFAILFWSSNKSTKWFSIVASIALLFIGVWCIRNYNVFNSFVFISSNSGLNLLLGNSENTTPNAGVTVDISKYTSFVEAAQFNEIDRDAYFRAEAIKFFLNNKLHSIKLYSLKFLNYFNYRNDLWNKAESSTLRDFVMLVTYGPLLTFFILRILLIKIFPPSKFEALLITLYISSALFHAIFFTRIRFRLPFDFLLISLVAIFIQQILTYLNLYTPQIKNQS